MPTTKSTSSVARTTNVPEGAKKPTDHQAKAPARDKPVVERDDAGVSVTYYGVSVTIDPEALNDYELLEDAASGEATALPSVLARLLGTEQVERVKEALRDPDTGRIRVEGERSMSSWLEDVFEAVNPS